MGNAQGLVEIAINEAVVDSPSFHEGLEHHSKRVEDADHWFQVCIINLLMSTCIYVCFILVAHPLHLLRLGVVELYLRLP